MKYINLTMMSNMQFIHINILHDLKYIVAHRYTIFNIRMCFKRQFEPTKCIYFFSSIFDQKFFDKNNVKNLFSSYFLQNYVQTWFMQEESLHKRQNNGRNQVIVRNKN